MSNLWGRIVVFLILFATVMFSGLFEERAPETYILTETHQIVKVSTTLARSGPLGRKRKPKTMIAGDFRL